MGYREQFKLVVVRKLFGDSHLKIHRNTVKKLTFTKQKISVFFRLNKSFSSGPARAFILSRFVTERTIFLYSRIHI